MFDLILRAGRVVDGSGGPWFRADLGVREGRIERIGMIQADAETRDEIDASGKLVCPGLIDIHRHSDFTLLVHPPADSALLQGITTEVIGNCGFGPAPALQPELTPMNILFFQPDAGIDVTWRTFGEYLDALDTASLGVNVVPLVAHSPIRTSVMGYEASPASHQQLGRMRELVDDAMLAGAFGLSSGLEYTPGSTATPEELETLARVVATHGGIYVTHVRNRWLGIVDADREALDLARRVDVPVHISHITARRLAASDNATLLADVDEARAEGLDVTYDTYPYTTGVGSMTEVLPPWAMEGDVTEVLDRFRDSDARARIAAYPNSANVWPLLGKWDYITLTHVPGTPSVEGKSMATIAEEAGKDPWTTLFDLFLAAGEEFASISAVAVTMHETNILETVQRDVCSIGSDAATQGGPLSDVVLHAGGSYGFTARVFDRFVKERKVLSWEQAINKLTGLPASRLGLHDRGLLVEGFRADIAVLDPQHVKDNASTAEPNRSPSGFQHVVVNGKVAVRDGGLTGVTSGRVLRRRAA